MIERKFDLQQIEQRIAEFPVVALLGPRQCGKTTLANTLPYTQYFDLESPRHLARLDHPQIALEQKSGLIVIDEIQRRPDLFPVIRYLVDNRPDQKFLILGSASGELMKQNSESLAGRIAYYELGGFRLHDVGAQDFQNLWLRGAFPRSYLAKKDEASLLWRDNFLATFLERDIPQLGIAIPAATLRRFWMMLCHYHGQVMNYSEFGRSFGVSDTTVRRYLEILEGAFMLRILQPWHVNLGKRLVKQPKTYVRDSGLLHALLSIESMEQLTEHNKLGASWEGFAVECACRSIGKQYQQFYFWATHTGAEVDLFWQAGGRNWGIECKYADAPRKTKSMDSALNDLDLAHLWVIYPGTEMYPLSEKITVLPLQNMPATWSYDVAA